MELLNNKLFKIIGIIAILYFALFHDKNTPDSLGNRVSPEKIKEKFTGVVSVKENIANGLLKAKSEESQIGKQPLNSDKSDIVINDITIGGASEALSCLDEATISYKIYTNNNNAEVTAVASEKIIIGSKQNLVIENNIIGMKKGGIRDVILPPSYKINDSTLQNTLQNGLGLTYKVVLLEFHKSNLDKSINCD